MEIWASELRNPSLFLQPGIPAEKDVAAATEFLSGSDGVFHTHFKNQSPRVGGKGGGIWRAVVNLRILPLRGTVFSALLATARL